MSNLFIYAAFTGAIGGAFVQYFGNVQGPLLALVIAMAIDFVTGVLCASLFKSNKTDKGGLESNACAKGLARKGVILLVVILGQIVDLLFDVGYFCPTIVIGFIFSEVISIIENCGIMGIPLPPAVTNMVEALRKESDKGGKEDDKDAS